MLHGKPIICISTNLRRDDTDPRKRIHELQDSYANAIFHAGGIPILAGNWCTAEMAELCDGLLLTGGLDIEPELYGEEPLNESVVTLPERTAFEKQLLEAFLERRKPIMGICRGAQLINVCMGGTLYQDLEEQKGLDHRVTDMRHSVRAEEGSLLWQLFGREFVVNSSHHQAVKDLAPGFHVTARSMEGIVEAFTHDTLPIFAVQFHPERLTGVLWDDRTHDHLCLFEHLIDCAKDHKDPAGEN